MEIVITEEMLKEALANCVKEKLQRNNFLLQEIGRGCALELLNNALYRTKAQSKPNDRERAGKFDY